MADLVLIEYRLKAQEAKITRLEEHIDTLERKAAEREEARASNEKKQLLAGISFLGAIVLTLGGVIWSYRGVIFRGVN